MAGKKAVDILLVEDIEADARLTMEVLKDGNMINNCVWAKDGEEALAALHREGEFADAPRPDVILLDLNLPKKHGHDVLSEIKQNPVFKSIPVVVLTTSTSEEDIVAAYTPFADCYVAKPLELDEFAQALDSLGNFWVNITHG